MGLELPPAAAAGELVLEKSVNGQPADQGPGPTVTSGSVVNFVYTVTVHSSEPLYDVRVSDTSNVTPSCDINGDGKPDGFDFHPGPLQGGASFVCSASETAGDPGLTFASLGKVRAIDFLGTASFAHQDPAHYTTVAAATTAPPTTKRPTTKPPTTAAPTTQAPATKPPTTAAPTTQAPTTEATATSGAESTNRTTASNSTASTPSSEGAGLANADNWRPSTLDSMATAEPASTRSEASTPDGDGDDTGDDPDAGPPSELAAADDGSEPSRGLSPWLLLLTFAAGAGLALVAMKVGPLRDSAPGQ
jgi:hypothetical protein